MNERSQIDLNGFLYILMLPLTTTVLCNHDKITLRAEAASTFLFSLDSVMADFMCQPDWAADAQIFG